MARINASGEAIKAIEQRTNHDVKAVEYWLGERFAAEPTLAGATGFSTAEVAEQMNVQYETAKTYLRRVREKYTKVGRPASKKAELIRRAAEDGYLE